MCEKKKERRIPDSELELMKLIWHSDRPVTSADLMEALKGRKTWGVTTILNLLSRLQEKGFLTSEKKGRFHYFSPLISEDTYRQQEGRSILSRLYGNSVKNFVASLYQGKSISNDDLQELKDFIESHSNEEEDEKEGVK